MVISLQECIHQDHRTRENETEAIAAVFAEDPPPFHIAVDAATPVPMPLTERALVDSIDMDCPETVSERVFFDLLSEHSGSP